MKKALADLQSAQDAANLRADSMEEKISELYKANEEAKQLARAMAREAMDKMKAEFTDMKEEMDHKFSLQVAENKRLQSHLTTAKNENAAMEKRVVILEKRMIRGLR